MGEKEMFEYWSQTYRVHNLDWSQEKAALILDAWQRKFTQVSDFDSILQRKIVEIFRPNDLIPLKII